MAIYSIHEMWEPRKASQDVHNVREYTRGWRVITTTPYDGPPQASLFVGLYVPPNVERIPPLFSYYQDTHGGVDFGALARKFSIRQLPDDPKIWEVTLEYSSKIENPEQARDGKVEQNPLLRPSKIKWSMEKYQKAVDQAYDTDGTLSLAIVNSAGEKFDPVTEIDDSRIVLSIDRNEATVDPAIMQAYQDALNADTFFGWDPGYAKMSELSADSDYQNGIFFWAVHYSIHFRREGWALKPLDQGFYELDSSTPKNRVLMVDPKSGQSYSSPVLLDGNGKRLAVGSKPVFLNFNVYKALPFAPLNLP